MAGEILPTFFHGNLRVSQLLGFHTLLLGFHGAGFLSSTITAENPSPSPRIVNIKGDTKPADRCDVETLKGANPLGDDEFMKVFF